MRKTWNERIHMGRRIRRLAAGLSGVALAVLLGVSPVMAEVQQIDPERTDGSISLTIQYKDDKGKAYPIQDGAGISVYPVAAVKVYNGYRFDLSQGVFADRSAFSEEDRKAVEVIPELTQEEWDKATNHNLADILAKYTEGRKGLDASTSAGTAAVSGLCPGLYLVTLSRRAEDDATFRPFLISLPDAEGNYQVKGEPKTDIVPPETTVPSSETPPSTETPPPSTETPPPSTENPPPDNPHNPPDHDRPDRDRPPGTTGYRETPPTPETTPPPESGVLGAVRDNGQQVLGAIRNPGQVLGAVRTGDPSAIFICGELLVLSSLMLTGWIALYRRIRR